MRLVCLRKLARESALEAERRKLRGELYDQDGVGEAPQDRGAVDSARNEKERQTRGQPYAEPQEVDPAPARQRCKVSGWSGGG